MENEFNKILFQEQLYYIKRSNKTFFKNNLKKFIKNIYSILDIPNDCFIVSLFYLNKFYNLNKNNDLSIKYLFSNIKIFVFTGIIIALKQLLDQNFSIKSITNLLNLDYDEYIKTELIILKGIDWDASFNTNDFFQFKKLMEHLVDLHLHKD